MRRLVSNSGLALVADAGYASVGVDHDTSEFTVKTLRRWWRETGQASYPGAGRLLMTYARSASKTKWNKIEGSSVTSRKTRGDAGW